MFKKLFKTTNESDLLKALKKQIAQTANKDIEEIDATMPLSEFGIDSFMAYSFLTKLNETLESLSIMVFMQCQNLKDLEEYIQKNYPDKTQDLVKNLGS